MTAGSPRASTEIVAGPSRGTLVGNILYNFLGHGAPVAAALVSIPILIRALGTERFGVLTLAWAVVGYFSLLDIGLGRATTKFVAEYLASGRTRALRDLVWTAFVLLLGLGTVAGLLVAGLTPWLVGGFFKVASALGGETERAFYLLGGALPFVVATAGARGVLEGQQRFAAVNLVKVPASVFLFLGPLLVLPFSQSLVPIVAILVASRVAAFVVYAYLALGSVPALGRPRGPDREQAAALLRFGGWLALTNVVGSLMAMGYVDRALIGSMLTMSDVAYYATPFELVTKLWIVPSAVLSALFPLFSAYGTGGRDVIGGLQRRAVVYLTAGFAPLVVAIVVGAEPLLRLWLGPDVAAQSSAVLRILAVGVLANCLAQVPFTAIQAMGRPDLTAKRHLLELPFYLLGMWVGIGRLGIIGAALVWLGWAVADALLVFAMYRALAEPVRSARAADDAGARGPLERADAG